MNAVDIIAEEEIHLYNQKFTQEESEYKISLLEHKKISKIINKK